LAKQKRPITIDDLYNIATIEDPRVSPDGRWIAYVHVTVNKSENTYKRNIWLASTDGTKPLQITRGGKDSQPRWSPDGTMLAFTSGRGDTPQIYILPVNAPGGEARPLTSQANGATSPAWSPDGSLIAFLSALNTAERKDEDAGKEPPVPVDKAEGKYLKERRDYDETMRWDPRWVDRIPYRAGTGFLDDRYAQIYVIATAEGLKGDDAKPRRLTSLETHYSQPHWSPDGKTLLTSRATEPEIDEPSRSEGLFRIRVKDGKESGLAFSARHVDAAPLPSPDGHWVAFIRTLRANQYSLVPRLSIVGAEGGKVVELSTEFDRTPVDFRWSADSRSLVAIFGDQGDGEIYRVTLKGKIDKIAAGRMQAEVVSVSPEGGVAFSASTPQNPSELFWQPAGADEPIQITDANTEFLDGVIVQPVREMRFASHDGLEIQGWYMLPVGYEKGEKYPMILNIHGGPHVMWGPSARTMWHEWQVHAAMGYVVYFSNPRGGDGYGEPFQRAIHRAWGEADFPDLMEGVDQMIAKGFVDPKRMAVTGGSYGGFMTAWVVGHTNRFAAAFSQRGVYNLSSFYGTSDIPALITDEFDVEPWEANAQEFLWTYSPLAYAHQIKTPIIIKAGENDFRVPIEQSEQLFAFIRRSGGTARLLRYPRDGHELSRAGEPLHRASRLAEQIAWFDKYCRVKRKKA
jgi:dipeptidyl aminopeptidase/acylaminoacyl peptidase